MALIGDLRQTCVGRLQISYVQQLIGNLYAKEGLTNMVEIRTTCTQPNNVSRGFANYLGEDTPPLRAIFSYALRPAFDELSNCSGKSSVLLYVGYPRRDRKERTMH